MGGKVLELESERLLSEGRKEGAAKLGKLVSALLKENRYSDIEKVSSDELYREELYKEFDSFGRCILVTLVVSKAAFLLLLSRIISRKTFL